MTEELAGQYAGAVRVWVKPDPNYPPDGGAAGLIPLVPCKPNEPGAGYIDMIPGFLGLNVGEGWRGGQSFVRLAVEPQRQAGVA